MGSTFGVVTREGEAPSQKTTLQVYKPDHWKRGDIMGTNIDIKTSNPGIQPLAEFDPKEEQAPESDQREDIKPLKMAVAETGDEQQETESATPDNEDAGKQELPLDEINEQTETDEQDPADDQGDETEGHSGPTDDKLNDPLELDSGQKQAAVAPTPDDSDGDAGGDSEDKTTDEALSAVADHETASDEGEVPEDETDDGGQKPENTRKNRTDQKAAEAAEYDKKTEALPKGPGHKPKVKKPAKDATTSKKLALSAVLILTIMGAVIYSKPALFGLKGKSNMVEPAQTENQEPARQPEVQPPQQQPSGENDRFRSKLSEASRLRAELLAKREEIYRLKLHYRHGIDELKDQIYREIQANKISAYEEAMQNKRIELNLRTIQRRRVYIQELEKPDQWAFKGSEELLFLTRKTLIDLEVANIASGVDLDRHMRYINAAIQKYRPSADRLAIDPPPSELTPLETIWRQIRTQQSEQLQAPVGEKNEKIIEEICSGDFTRIAQLTAITPQAAQCLARMDGSELFLNGLTQLTAKDAEHLFKWRGSWICLNGIKHLSPAAAKFLFNWEGNWISLNGLTELPPELALYLTEWKGNQLELMGLDSDKSKPDDRALKYLARWETMGGKLFISDNIRNEMKRVM